MVPLTVAGFNRVAALFKAAEYLSYSNYAYRAKSAHIAKMRQHGIPWTDDLEQVLKDTRRSVTRGAGGARQSCPVDAEKVWALHLDDDPISPGGPVGPADFVIAGAFFLTREIEIAAADMGNIRFDTNRLMVTWRLPMSKVDPLSLIHI